MEWYLTRERSFTAAYYPLGSTAHGPLERAEWLIGQSELTVPAGVPSGYYFLGAYIRGDESAETAGFPFWNSSAWTRRAIWVQGR